MAKRVKIPGRLESAETGNIVTGADAVMDDAKGKTQVVINSEVDAAIINLAQGKQDNLTFDNAPTEDSPNPVTSGGVYTADKVLSDAIEAILLLIPSAASALNKLVDMQTMNSSIATATASFKGTYNLVSDLHLGVDATHEQIGAALDALSLGADNNDYAFVQVPNSATAPTEISKTERYKFNGTNWLFEYDLNNSGFTQGQWNAINSGVTSLLVGKLSDLPTNAELTTLLAGKQDNLTFDDVPTSGSPNPVKSGGVYARNNEIVALINALDAAKQDVLTFDNAPVQGSPNPVKSGGVYTAISAVQAAIVALDAAKQNVLTFDSTPTLGSPNPVTSSGIKTELNRIDSAIVTLDNLYRALTQSSLVVVAPTDTWPVVSPDATTIYRVVDRVNTPPQNYSDYMWNGTAMVLMAQYDNAIDDEPTAGSDNLVKSGGVYKAIKDSEIVDGGVDTEAELSFVDGNDNCIAQFSQGHIKTKEFDSRDMASVAKIDDPEEDEESLSFVDEESNCIAQFKDGHIKTRNFDSRDVVDKKRFASVEISDLTITGSSSISNEVITLQSGVANKVYLDGTIQGRHYKMIQTVKFENGTPNIVIGKDDSTYGTSVEIEGSSLTIVNNNVTKDPVDIGFSLQADREYTIVWDYNVTTSKSLTIEIYDDFGNYFTYTTDYTVHGYGKPYTYSKSATCSIIKWVMTMQHYYNPVTSKMIVAGHSYVEADTLGQDRNDCFTSLLEDYNGDGTVVNCGLGGDTIDNVNKKLAYYIKMNPNVEFAMGCVGRNDTASAETIIAGLLNFVNICVKRGIKPILMTIEPDSNGYHNNAFPNVNSWIRSSGYLYVDLDKVFYNADGTINQTLYLDGVHPTVEGHLRIYRRIQMDCPFLF